MELFYQNQRDSFMRVMDILWSGKNNLDGSIFKWARTCRRMRDGVNEWWHLRRKESYIHWTHPANSYVLALPTLIFKDNRILNIPVRNYAPAKGTPRMEFKDTKTGQIRFSAPLYDSRLPPAGIKDHAPN